MNQNAEWQAIKKCRLDLADFLKTLNEEQWNTPSLCANWRVRDVVAHVVLESRYTKKNSWKRLVKHRFNLNTFMYAYAREMGRKPSRELVEMLREDAGKKVLPFLTKPTGILVDLLIHEQDIRMVLGKDKAIDQRLLKHIFSAFGKRRYGVGEVLVGVKKNIRNLHLKATDIDWEYGKGELTVEGDAQDLLMAMVGRNATIHRLEGPGVIVLTHRLKHKF